MESGGNRGAHSVGTLPRPKTALFWGRGGMERGRATLYQGGYDYQGIWSKAMAMAVLLPR